MSVFYTTENQLKLSEFWRGSLSPIWKVFWEIGRFFIKTLTLNFLVLTKSWVQLAEHEWKLEKYPIAANFTVHKFWNAKCFYWNLALFSESAKIYLSSIAQSSFRSCQIWSWKHFSDFIKLQLDLDGKWWLSE